MKIQLFCTLISTLHFVRCTSDQQGNENIQTTTQTSIQMKTEKEQPVPNNVVKGNNQFATDILKNYSASADYKGKNIFISPLSIYTALAMVSEGAQEQTLEEMNHVLYFPENVQEKQQHMDSLMNKLNPIHASYKLSLVNALWAQNDYEFRKEFVSATQRYYKANVAHVDYKNKPMDAVKTINSWVEKATNEKIKNLISDKNVTKDTRLILTNAIYFKADWAHPFEVSATKISEFILADNTKIEASIMNTNGMFPYMENELLQSVEIPYKGDELSMTIILPKAGISPEQLLTKVNVTDCFTNRDTWERVRLSMPKFKVEAKYLMKDEFKKMGLLMPFTEKANFLGISKADALVIGEIIHQTFVEVNETGTEAAAATAVGLDAGSAPKQPKIFNANHPFIYVIRHNVTGAILFTGVLNNPNEM
jgi:serpin B